MKRKVAKYPFAFDKNKIPIRPEDALLGEEYFCPKCGVAQLILIKTKERLCYFRSVRGTVHASQMCKKIEDGEGNVQCDILDKNRLLKNGKHRKNGTKPPAERKPGPGIPHKEPNNVFICSSLKEIYQKRIYELDDCILNNGDRLTDHFVSAKNAYLTMNNNHSLGIRALEVVFEYLLPWHQTIRFVQEAEQSHKGQWKVARRVIDFVCENNAEFIAARDTYFWSYRKNNGALIFLPKYHRAFIVGDFHEIHKDRCKENFGCSKMCVTKYYYCIGRQTASLKNARGQIFVDESDRIDYPYLKG